MLSQSIFLTMFVVLFIPFFSVNSHYFIILGWPRNDRIVIGCILCVLEFLCPLTARAFFEAAPFFRNIHTTNRTIKRSIQFKHFFVCHNKKQKRNIMLFNAVDNDPYSWWLRTWEKLNLTMWSFNLWRDIYYHWVLLFYDRFVCRQFHIAILLFGQHQMIWFFFLLQTIQ